MSARSLSISQRLAKAKAPETKKEVAKDWAANWQQEQQRLVAQLERAVAADDYDQLCQVTGQIKAVSEKRFGALPKVLDALLPDPIDWSPAWAAGLTNRTASCLVSAGFRSREAVAEALRDPAYRWQAIPNFGTKCKIEIEEWIKND